MLDVHEAGNYPMILSVLEKEQLVQKPGKKKQWKHMQFFFLLHVKTKLTLHFSAKASRITSTNFWKEKAMTPLYYIGSGYELFKNEGNGKDILKYAGAQNMSPAKLSWKIYLNIDAIQLRK